MADHGYHVPQPGERRAEFYVVRDMATANILAVFPRDIRGGHDADAYLRTHPRTYRSIDLVTLRLH